MKAVVYREYGPPEVLRVEEVPKPVPAADEVLVRVRAASVAAADWRLRKADPFLARLFNGLLRPKRVNVLGLELSGEVEAAGKDVRRFKAGDPVFAFTGFGFGAHAEYRCLRERGVPAKDGLVVHKPYQVGFEQAAAIPVGALTAQAFLRQAKVGASQKVLVLGASGSVGTFAVQLARHLGAQVTGLCSTDNVPLVQSLGAEEVIDYTKEDFAEQGHVYDVVFDAVGKYPSRARKALARGGRYVTVRSSPRLEQDDLEWLRGLCEQGRLRPVIDRTYPLEQAAEAHRYVEQGHKKGNVVLTVA